MPERGKLRGHTAGALVASSGWAPNAMMFSLPSVDGACVRWGRLPGGSRDADPRAPMPSNATETTVNVTTVLFIAFVITFFAPLHLRLNRT